MSLLDSLDPVLIPYAHQLFDLAERAGARPRITSAFRTHTEQQALYVAWINGHRRFPAAPPGRSAHEYGLAFDMVVPKGTDQQDLGTVWVSWGGVYGGTRDPVHFEYPGFSPPAQVASAGPDPTQTATDTQYKLERLADLFLSWLPSPYRILVNTAQLATQLYSIGAGKGDLAYWTGYWLSHPVEFVGEVWDPIWRWIWTQI